MKNFKHSGDPLADAMRSQGIPITRETYLNLAYMGHPPARLDPEIEGMLPAELQAPDDLPVPLVPIAILRRRKYFRRRLKVIVKSSFLAFALLLGLQAHAQSQAEAKSAASKAKIDCAKSLADMRIAQDLAVNNFIRCAVQNNGRNNCGPMMNDAMLETRRLGAWASIHCILEPPSVANSKVYDVHYAHKVEAAKAADSF